MMTQKTYSSVVLTGASGWLGRNMTRALLFGLPDCPDLTTSPFAGLPLRLIDCVPAADDTKHPSVSFVQADITKEDDCQMAFDGIAEGALVIHCAGLIHPRKIADLESVNLNGTKRVYAAARRMKARRVVILSSNSPCGCNADVNDLFDEESPYNPYMAYGRSKMLMERHIRSQSEAPTWTLIRAPWFYGPFQPPRQLTFFSMIKAGKGPIVGDGENKRSMAHTDNLAQGVIRAAINDCAAGQIYWIADAEPYTMNQIIDTVERLFEEEFDILCQRGRLRLPGFAADIAYVCDWLLQCCGLYHQKIHVLSEMNKTIACSVDKARKELCYAPTVALEEGMRRSIRDCLQNGAKI